LEKLPLAWGPVIEFQLKKPGLCRELVLNPKRDLPRRLLNEGKKDWLIRIDFNRYKQRK